jgi:Flp pilus assembly protein TadG
MVACSSVRFIATAGQNQIAFRRRGTVMIMAVLMMAVLIGLASLAVDFGQVQWTKSKLSGAADAAALAAAADLPNTYAAAAAAQSLVASNIPDVSNLCNASQDIQFGNWNESTHTFVVTGNSINAVRVTLRRSTARGNAVKLAFGQLIGRPTCDVSASAIALVRNDSFGLVGLNYVKLSGSADATDADTTGVDLNGSVASNGNITLTGASTLTGDVRPGVGKAVIAKASSIHGTVRPLTSPLAFPAATAGSYATSNDNARIPAGTLTSSGDFVLRANIPVTLPGGVYYVRNLTGSGSASLTLTGPAVFYVTGDVSLTGNVTTNRNLPENFKIYQVPNASGVAGRCSLTGSADLYAQIYAPQSSISVTGNGDFYGSMIGLSIDITGSGLVHYGSTGNAIGGPRLVT